MSPLFMCPNGDLLINTGSTVFLQIKEILDFGTVGTVRYILFFITFYSLFIFRPIIFHTN
jgi:hypothetical protein